MKNQKRRIRKVINYSLDWEGDTEIQHIRKQLDKIEKLGATHIQIEYERGWENDIYLNIEPIMFTQETDHEYLERIRKEELQTERFKQQELRQLEILKSKYENNNETN